jgi:hypothetical protein
MDLFGSLTCRVNSAAGKDYGQVAIRGYSYAGSETTPHIN